MRNEAIDARTRDAETEPDLDLGSFFGHASGETVQLDVPGEGGLAVVRPYEERTPARYATTGE